ncbi:MAG: hypothetical protein IPO35_00895 [Uliginosibacterium sp.]|nr:hypothetical protein [Uliginosibacterium sp.]
MLNSIQSRLVLAILPIIASFVALGTIVWQVSAKTSGNISETVRNNTQVAAQIEQLSLAAQQIRRYEKEYFIYSSSADGRAKYRKEWTETYERMGSIVKDMQRNKAGLYTAEDGETIAKSGAALDFYAQEMDKIFRQTDERAYNLTRYVAPSAAEVLAATRAGKAIEPAPQMLQPSEVNDLIKAGKDRLAADFIKPLGKMGEARRNDTLALPEISSRGFNELAKIVVVLSGLGALIALATLAFLPRTIRGPLARLSAQVDALSKGAEPDTSEAIKVKEFRHLAEAVGRLARAQKMLLERVKRA